MKTHSFLVKILMASSLFCGATFTLPADEAHAEPMKKAGIPIEALISQMTLDEKCEQLKAYVSPANERLGIPALNIGETLHGVTIGTYGFPRPDINVSTSFPQPLAMAATWNTDLMFDVATVIAKEARAVGLHQSCAPNLDVCREPRWGRAEETFGEDPYLVSRMGVAYINGLQGVGAERFDHNHIYATAKHFVAHGIPPGGINGSMTDISMRTLHEVYLPPFEAAVKEAQVACVMPAYHDLNGQPCHTRQDLLVDLLRGQWGFDGFIISDARAIEWLRTQHQVAATEEEAAGLSLQAGVDLELTTFAKAPLLYQNPLKEAVQAGRIPEAWLDRALSRVLKAKFALALHADQDQPDPKTILNHPDHRQLALKAARQSIVLLKNHKKLLPLNKDKLSSIAVVGPNADARRLGGYTDLWRFNHKKWQKAKEAGDQTEMAALAQRRNDVPVVTILDGFRQLLGDQVQIRYAKGCQIKGSSQEGFAKAVQAAEQSDVAIVVVGESEHSNEEGVDRHDLTLLGQQQALVDAVLATGRPTIVVLMTGRPLAIPEIAESADALLCMFNAGVEGGRALAEIVLGEICPTGKLPITFPRHVGQLPLHYSMRPAFKGLGRGRYVDGETSPLFPFGFGLSYNRYEYSSLKLSSSQIDPDGQAQLEVTVSNHGSYNSDEIVQLYVHDQVSTFTRPLKELKAFKRVSVKAGESQVLRFEISKEHLQILDQDLEKVVEPGIFDLMVGSDSQQLQIVSLKIKE